MIVLQADRMTTFPACSPDGRFLAAVWDHHLVAVWDRHDLDRGPLVRTFPVGTGTVVCLTFLPDGRLFGADEDGGWATVSPLTGTFHRPRDGAVCNGYSVSPDGGVAVGCGWSLWRVRLDPRDVGQDDLPRPAEIWDGFELLFRSEGVGFSSVCWAPDGRSLVTAGSRRPSAESCTWRSEVRTPDGVVTAVLTEAVTTRGDDVWPTPMAFTPDGRHVAGLFGGRLHVWAVESGQLVAAAPEDDRSSALAATPDGQWLLTGDLSGRVTVREAVSGRSVRTYQWGTGRVRGLAVAADGLTALVGGDRGAVLFDLEV